MSSSIQATVFSSLATFLLILMLLVSVTNSVTQQYFYSVKPIQQYVANLIKHGSALRAIIGLDNLFILFYFLATYFFHLVLAQRCEHPQLLSFFVFIVGVIALLDYQENFHILAMLASSHQSIPLTEGQVELQYVLNAIEWPLAYAAFFILGLSIHPRNWLEKLFVFSLIFIQMPIGVLVYTAGSQELERLFMVFRYTSLLSGFILIAVISFERQRSALQEKSPYLVTVSDH